MDYLYLIGGSPRCGKTTIFNEVIRRKPMVAIPTDAIRAGVRYLNQHKRIDFSEDMIENQLPWEMVVGIIHRYDHKRTPLIIEGVVVTPERVKSLALKNLKLRVAFVGFIEDAYIEKILEYGHVEKDWVHEHVEKHNGNDSAVRKVFKSLQKKNKETAEKAKEYGYRFFTPESGSFKEYTNSVAQYLIG